MPGDVQLNLNEVNVPCRKDINGTVNWTVSAGGRVRIQTKEVGEDIDDILDETVPSGKSWQVVLSIKILETDV